MKRKLLSLYLISTFLLFSYNCKAMEIGLTPRTEEVSSYTDLESLLPKTDQSNQVSQHIIQDEVPNHPLICWCQAIKATCSSDQEIKEIGKRRLKFLCYGCTVGLGAAAITSLVVFLECYFKICVSPEGMNE